MVLSITVWYYHCILGGGLTNDIIGRSLSIRIILVFVLVVLLVVTLDYDINKQTHVVMLLTEHTGVLILSAAWLGQVGLPSTATSRQITNSLQPRYHPVCRCDLAR